jgi:hypothetical protein
MRFLTLAQATPPPYPEFVESTFFKLVALAVMLLWAVYLIKEIFFAHKEDQRMSALISTSTQTATQLAVLANNIQHLTDGQREQWQVINGLRKSITTIAADHAQLEGRAIAAGRDNPLRG